MSSQSEQVSRDQGSKRVAPLVALALLEVIRDQDLPGELLAAEDLTLTLPRRLGLSDVIDAQIRRYQQERKRRRRVSEEEIRALVGLVVRRPDSEEVFRLVGLRLAGVGGEGLGWIGLLPRRIAFALARREARKRLKTLFGRRVGEFRKGPFALAGRDLLFIRSDPGGEACFLLSGLLSAVVGRYMGPSFAVVHESCQAWGGETCVWSVVRKAEDVPQEEDSASLGAAPEVA